jgi:hypothetical protein
MRTKAIALCHFNRKHEIPIPCKIITHNGNINFFLVEDDKSSRYALYPAYHA